MDIYTSNTTAASGNQYIFTSDLTAHTGRAFYKITHGGIYNYRLLFSNTLDSTFADGSESICNTPCPQWTIHQARIGCCESAEPALPIAFTQLSFDGQKEKVVAPGEAFWSDPVRMEFHSGSFLCLELTFSGTVLPYHAESLLPIFQLEEKEWVYDKRMPLPGMIGCDRSIKKRIGFLGDSITQGIGTEVNSYQHWCALLSEKLPADLACWNLGLGYGRVNDLASNGIWLEKAKRNDVVFLCCGVNDLLQGLSEEQIKKDIQTIVALLKAEGIIVILQTIPPFDYSGETIEIWNRINAFIKTLDADLVFDNVPILGVPEKPQNAIYGGHPNAEGCRIWADALNNFLTGSDIL